MKPSVLVVLKGFLMGAADVVPGVSGGTLALVTGIYPRLIACILAFNAKTLRLALTLNFKEVWLRVDGAFLLPLVLGIGAALLSMSRLLHFLLLNYPEPTWGAFFGFVLSSALTLFFSVASGKPSVWLSLVVGVAFGYLVLTLTPSSVSVGYPYLFFCGAISICATILPGVSGSYVLVLMGVYASFLGFLKNPFSVESLLGILTFGAGAAVGLAAFSRLLGKLLEKFPEALLAAMTGVMLGSLAKIWPWKSVVGENLSLKETLIHSRNVLPDFGTPSVWGVLLPMAVSLAAGYLLARSGASLKTPPDERCSI